MYPEDRHYSPQHEWVLLQGDGQALVGITHFAQDQLGDIVFVDLPEVGGRYAQFGKLAELESVKAVSDIYTPVGGQVAEVNQELIDHPELVNQEPYGRGWLVRLAGVESQETDTLLTSAGYQQFLAQPQ